MGNEDYYNGFLGAVAVLLALEHRARTGEGQYLESPHLHSSLFVTTEQCLDEDGRAVSPWQLDHEQLGFGPLYRLYQTSDGWLALACVGRRRLRPAAGALELVAAWPTRTTGGATRRAGGGARRSASASSRPTTAFALLDGHGVPCEIAVADPYMPEFLWDEWALSTQRVVEHEEHYSVGYIREMGLVVRLSDTPGVVKGTAPRLGEHSVEILDELGYQPAEIEALVTGVCIDGRPAESAT